MQPSPPIDPLVALARAAAGGDQGSLAELIGATHADTWRLCVYLVDRQSADDLAQETYLRVHRGLPGYRGEAPPRTWILAIARRVCAAELDQRARRRDLALKVRPLAPTTGTPHRESADVDVELLVRALPAERRSAFVLTQVIGCSYAEAAAICGCPVGTIRSRVARAREELIAELVASEGGVASERGS